MPLEPVKSRRLYQEVADQLTRLIAEGEYQPGARLPAERELAISFEVSRSTVREAMMALELAGVIEIRTGSGNYVLDPTASSDREDSGPGPFELIEARICIEGETAALAALRIDENRIAELEKSVDEMERLISRHEPADEPDHRFHQIIAKSTGNSAMVSAVERLWEYRSRMPMWQKLHEVIRSMQSSGDWTDDERSAQDHREIIKALRTGDPKAAREVMRRHLQRVHTVLLTASQFEEIRADAVPIFLDKIEQQGAERE